MSDTRASAGLGRHGTARHEPWHDRWLELRDGLRLVTKLTCDAAAGNAAAVTKLEQDIAESRAFMPFPSPALSAEARGHLIAETVRDAARGLRQPLVIPLNKDAAPEQAILFWYLALCEGQPASWLGRHLATYVVGVETTDPQQWVAQRMWATGKVPHARSGPGLASLSRRIDLGLITALSADGSDGANAIIENAIHQLTLEASGAASWLAVFAHFAPDPIPLSPLQAEAPRGLPQVYGPIDRLPVSTYVDQLADLGLLAKLDNGDYFLMPPAVATAVLQQFDANVQVSALRASIVLLGMAFDEDCDEPGHWASSELMVPHVLAVVDFAERVPIAREDAAIFLTRTARYYRTRAQPTDAITTARRAVAVLEIAKGAMSPLLTSPLYELARALIDNDELVEAESVLQRVIHLEEVGAHSPEDRATTLDLYGNLLKRMGRLLEAEAALRRARELFSDNRPEAYYRLLNQLGRVVEELGREEEALGLYYESLEGLRGAWGSNHVKRNIALTLAGLGRLEESRDLLEEILSSEEATPVRDEGFIAWIIRPLAVAHRELGNDARADELYSRLADLMQPWVS